MALRLGSGSSLFFMRQLGTLSGLSNSRVSLFENGSVEVRSEGAWIQSLIQRESDSEFDLRFRVV